MIAKSQPSLGSNTTNTRRTQPLIHFAAGASGGAATSLLTSPLDVLRTRLQSDLYEPPSRSANAGQAPRSFLNRTPLGHVFETFDILRSIKNNEGWRGLFRGIGPSLAGVVPATAIKFYVYGNTKLLAARYLDYKEDDPIVHAHAAIAAAIATATATNPIWLVKTRLQLDKSRANQGATVRQYKGSLDCVQQVLQKEGIPGLYRGLSASYLGTVETVLHLVVYERLKILFQSPFLRHRSTRNPAVEELGKWVSTSGAAGCAKFAAVLVTYPHEVIRTRLRQAPTANGRQTYTGLGQCFNLVWKQEGWRGLYGGLTPHLVRSIPSAVITLGVYEFVLRVANTSV
ncbi:Putative mitochondrial carrier protein [Colletotrichum destructivum]|uniref:Mitochondrial carrier protein n=1 Tax=Colletotrichum destructivum TaxID=34406 RepID=A0AAX4J1S2_9PEZI|nr:Putative mitochondrial carrier protein [Colletotrichum destructivum]